MVVKKRQSVNVQEDGSTKRRKQEVPIKASLPVDKIATETHSCALLPKRPAQPKQLFINNKLEQLRNKPDFSKKKALAELKLQWHGLSDNEKQKWVDQASEEENKYIEKLQIFKAGNPDVKKSILGVLESVTKKRTAKALRLAGLPKKPIPAKQMYVEDRLGELEKESHFNKKKARAEANLQWDSLSDADRQVWTKRAAEEGKKYVKMLKLFKTDNPEIEIPKVKATKEGVKKGLSGKSVRPPKSGYSLYFKTLLAKSDDLKALEPEEQMKVILSRWNKMPDSEKEQYRSKVESEQEKYKQKVTKKNLKRTQVV